MCKALRGNNDKPKTVEEYIAQKVQRKVYHAHGQQQHTRAQTIMLHMLMLLQQRCDITFKEEEQKKSIGIRKVLP